MASLISAQQLKEKLNEIFLLDVRTPEEYKEWRINKSINIPVDKIKTSIGKIPKDKEIIIICAHGIRSKMVADLLGKSGYNAKSVLGGMSAWNSVYDSVSINIGNSKLIQVRRIGKGCIGYLAVSDGEAAVIDPSVHTGEFAKIALQFNSKITKVFDTHQHADHVSGARILAGKIDAELFLNPLDAYAFSGFNAIKDGNKINIGDVEIEAVHTPGHTKGSTSFLVNDKILITGDTLFIDGVARPDLRDKSAEFALDLFNTYHNKFLSMDSSTDIFPGHFAAEDDILFGKAIVSKLSQVRKRLKVFDLSKNEFLKSFANIPPKPPNYQRIISMNKGEIPFNPDEAEELEAGPNRCVVKK